MDYFQNILLLIEYLPHLIVVFYVYKLYCFWNINKQTRNNEHLSFHPSILDFNTMYKSDEIPSAFPNLWYPVIQSNDIKPGQVKPLHVIGQNLALFRTTSGKVHVLDAFCPHLGAHLGVGGTVVGDDIRCPFHSWTFNGDGVCTAVPGLPNTPKAKIKSWKCTEVNDWVYVWYDYLGRDSKWQPKEFKTLFNKTKWGEITSNFNGHIMDICSNPSETVHFNEIHTLKRLKTTDQSWSFTDYIFNIFHLEFEDPRSEIIDDQDSPLIFVYVDIIPIIFNIRLNMFKMEVKSIQSPPVMFVTQTLNKFNLRIHILNNLISISPMKNIVVNNIYHDSSFGSKLLARIAFYLYNHAAGPEETIYFNKKFLMDPCLTSLDKSQVSFARWFKKNFYD